jgi:hypothetical protein
MGNYGDDGDEGDDDDDDRRGLASRSLCPSGRSTGTRCTGARWALDHVAEKIKFVSRYGIETRSSSTRLLTNETKRYH